MYINLSLSSAEYDGYFPTTIKCVPRWDYVHTIFKLTVFFFFWLDASMALKIIFDGEDILYSVWNTHASVRSIYWVRVHTTTFDRVHSSIFGKIPKLITFCCCYSVLCTPGYGLASCQNNMVLCTREEGMCVHGGAANRTCDMYQHIQLMYVYMKFHVIGIPNLRAGLHTGGGDGTRAMIYSQLILWIISEMKGFYWNQR